MPTGQTDTLITWLMEGDPAIRWMALRDLQGAPAGDWQAAFAQEGPVGMSFEQSGGAPRPQPGATSGTWVSPRFMRKCEIEPFFSGAARQWIAQRSQISLKL